MTKCASIKFFEHYRTQPNGRIGGQSSQCQDTSIALSHRGNIDGRIEKSGLHLVIQLAKNIFDLAAAPKKAFRGLKCQSISFMLADCEVKSAFDGLCLGFGPQNLLGTLYFYGIQLKVLVRAVPSRGHKSTP